MRIFTWITCWIRWSILSRSEAVLFIVVVVSDVDTGITPAAGRIVIFSEVISGGRNQKIESKKLRRIAYDVILKTITYFDNLNRPTTLLTGQHSGLDEAYSQSWAVVKLLSVLAGDIPKTLIKRNTSLKKDIWIWIEFNFTYILCANVKQVFW